MLDKMTRSPILRVKGSEIGSNKTNLKSFVVCFLICFGRRFLLRIPSYYLVDFSLNIIQIRPYFPRPFGFDRGSIGCGVLNI